MSANATPLAIYGGAFDPVHLGHMALCCAVRDTFDVEVHLLPTGDPRHRSPAHAAAWHRIAMLETAQLEVHALKLPALASGART